MTGEDISKNIHTIRELMNQVAAADLPPAEREVIKVACNAGLNLLEGLLLDLHTIAYCAERK